MTPDDPTDQNTVRNLDSPRQLAEWANTLVADHRRHLASPAPSPRPACIDDSSAARLHRTWEDLSAGFARLQNKNLLVEGADPAVLATAFMAALQGGYLLSAIARHTGPLEVAVEMALQQVARSLTEEPPRPHDRSHR